MDKIIQECEASGNQYEDPDFPASNFSLSLTKALVENIVWLRIKDILEKRSASPELWFVDRYQLLDITRGKYGSSEFVGALATITQKPDLFHMIFDYGQLQPAPSDTFSRSQLFGIYSFRFWFNGVWQEVVVDDRLPTSEDGKLVFVTSRSENNFLPSLLEKAYAKLLGSYEAISHNTLPEILHHLTGGVVESFNLDNNPPSTPFLINSIFKVLEMRSLIGCCINIWDKNTGEGTVLSCGLITNHQYILNDIREIKLVTDRNEVPLTLVRLKNPWGNVRRWKGPWSIESLEWKKVTKEDRESMGLYLNSDAEFWMNFAEFLHLFDLDFCHLLVPSHLSVSSLSSSPVAVTNDEARSTRWDAHLFHGTWRKSLSAGGRPSCKDSHWMNPQCLVTLKHMDHDDNNSYVLIVELEQKSSAILTSHENRKEIGFVLYQCPKSASPPLPREFFEENNFVDSSHCYTNLRFVVKRFVLRPGTYAVVPSTYKPDVEGSFILRVLVSDAASSVEFFDGSDPSTPLPRSGGKVRRTISDPSKDPKEEILQNEFLEMVGDDQQITLKQLRELLGCHLKLENQSKDFSLDFWKHLVSLVDKDYRTKLSLQEVLYLWSVIKSWKKSFFAYSKQGLMDSHELRPLIISFGYKLNPTVTSRLIYRYSNEQHKIDIEGFLTCMIRLFNLQNAFKQYEKNEKITCNLEEWMEISLRTL